MNYDNIIDRTKEIETILTDLGATGKGLHEKVSSIQDTLNKQVVKAIRYIATIRNNALHDANFKLTTDIVDEFEDAYEVVLLMLNIEIKKPKSNIEKIHWSDKLFNEDDIITKSNKGYNDPNNTKAKNEFSDEHWRYCPNCEEDIVFHKKKKDIKDNHYLIKYCNTCHYVFSSKKI